MTTQPPTPEETKRLLERLKELHEKATEGQWRLCDPDEHPWRIGPIEPERQNTVTIVNEHGYGIMCFPSEIGSGHTRDFEFAIEVHNAFPLLLSLAQRADALAEELQRYRDGESKSALVSGKPTWDQLNDLYGQALGYIAQFRARAEQAEDKLTSLQAENARITSRFHRVEDAAGKALQLSDPEADCEVILGELQEALLDDEIRAALTPPPDATEAQSTAKTEDDLCLCGSGHKVGECWRYASCTDAAKKKGHKFS